jgi:predicted peroxiredoxin
MPIYALQLLSNGVFCASFPSGTPRQGDNFMARRQFLAQLLGLPFLSFGSTAEESKKSLKIMIKSAWGSDDPTKAAFPFLHGSALADAGHEVQIFLLGEATSLMRKATANSVILSAGLHSAKLWKNLAPNTSLSLLEELAAGRVASRKPISPTGTLNSATPPSLSALSNGPTASSPSKSVVPHRPSLHVPVFAFSSSSA